MSAEFCLKLGWFRLEKNGGGALNPRPLVSAPQNPFVFQQEISKPKAHLSRRPFVGKSPQSEGAGGSGISGSPSRGEALRFWLSAGPCPAVCPWGGAGGAGPGRSFAPRAPQPVPAAARGSRGGGGAAPHNFKGESVFSSSPTPHQRIKKIKTQPRKRFCVPSPVSHVG